MVLKRIHHIHINRSQKHVLRRSYFLLIASWRNLKSWFPPFHVPLATFRSASKSNQTKRNQRITPKLDSFVHLPHATEHGAKLPLSYTTSSKLSILRTVSTAKRSLLQIAFALSSRSFFCNFTSVIFQTSKIQSVWLYEGHCPHSSKRLISKNTLKYFEPVICQPVCLGRIPPRIDILISSFKK